MANQRGIIENDPQHQGVDESIIRNLTTTNIGSSPASVEVKVYDVTTAGTYTDVTSTVMPTGSPSVSGDIITLPAMNTLTIDHRYRVEVKCTISGNIVEIYFHVNAER